MTLLFRKSHTHTIDPFVKIDVLMREVGRHPLSDVFIKFHPKDARPV